MVKKRRENSLNLAKFISRNENTLAITNVFEDEGPLKCAVAFWGAKALELLKDVEKDVHVICNLKSGGTNPFLIRRLSVKENVMVRTNERLHAKVFLGRNNAVVGSANISANGLDESEDILNGWIEAGVHIRGEDMLSEINDWFESEWKEAIPISETLLQEAEEQWKRRAGRRVKSPVPQRPKGWAKGQVQEALGEIFKGVVVKSIPVKWHRGWETYSIRLPEPNVNGIGEIGMPITGGDEGKPLVAELSLIFGDTMLQAEAFYSKNLPFGIFKRMEDATWNIHGSFHLGFMHSGYVWLQTPSKKTKAYYEFWKKNMDLLKTYPREDTRPILKRLEREGIIRITPENEKEFEKQVSKTQRKGFALRPGLGLVWAIREPELWQALSSSGRKILQDLVRNKIREVYTAIGLSPSFLR